MACAVSGGSSDEQAPVGQLWRWVEELGPDGASRLRIGAPSRYTLQLNLDGRYTLRADCNNGAGTYDLEGSELQLRAGALTRAACPPDSHAREFVRRLGDVVAWEMHGGGLELRLRREAGRLRFAPSRPPTLAGSHWRVRAYNSGRQAVVSPLAGSELTLEFGEHGQLGGSAGCNRYHASYALDGAALRLGPFATTQKACARPEGIMQQEQAYLAALGRVQHWSSSAERLDLRGADGARAVDLVSVVTGVVRLPPRVSLPEGSVLYVRLEDVSRQDAAALVVAHSVLRLDGQQVPIAFELVYARADVDPRMSYAITARIEDPAGELSWITQSAHPVLTRGQPSWGLEVVVEPVR